MSTPVLTVVNEGDSLTFPSVSYVYQYSGLTPADVPTSPTDLGPRTFVFRNVSPVFNGLNRAASASRIGDLETRAAELDAIIPASRLTPIAASTAPAGHAATARAARKYVLAVWIGANSTSPTGGGQADLVAAYLDARHAAGWDKILLATLLSRGDTDKAAFNVYRNAYNTVIRGGAWQASHFVDALFDCAADPDIGGNDACDDLDFFESDKVHLNTAGETIMAGIYGTALETVIATL